MQITHTQWRESENGIHESSTASRRCTAASINLCNPFARLFNINLLESTSNPFQSALTGKAALLPGNKSGSENENFPNTHTRQVFYGRIKREQKRKIEFDLQWQFSNDFFATTASNDTLAPNDLRSFLKPNTAAVFKWDGAIRRAPDYRALLGFRLGRR